MLHTILGYVLSAVDWHEFDQLFQSADLCESGDQRDEFWVVCYWCVPRWIYPRDVTKTLHPDV